MQSALSHFSYTGCHYAEHYNAECCDTVCHNVVNRYTKCNYAKCCILYAVCCTYAVYHSARCCYAECCDTVCRNVVYRYTKCN